MNTRAVSLIELEDLPIYPLDVEDRIDSHFFMAWERRRWLNSDMGLKGTPECRALYFDLINICFDHSPVGTLPTDMGVLAKLVRTERDHFNQLCKMDYGPLHKWQRCRCDDEVRLFHPFVLKTLNEAIARKAHNRAKNEAANQQKRLMRLRSQVAGYQSDLAKNDAAVLWIDGWLIREGCEYRSSSWIENAMAAWANHMFTLTNAAKM